MSDDDSESVSREASPCSESPRPVSLGSESPRDNICTSILPLNKCNSGPNHVKVNIYFYFFFGFINRLNKMKGEKYTTNIFLYFFIGNCGYTNWS